MSEALYERYKDALRRGHVAVLRGRLDVALAAYAEAASIAPDRPLPHASQGSVLLRLGRPADALAAFAAALARGPRDEGALAGRADALVALGRRAEAAEALDLLAEGFDGAGRLAEACDTARRALELAESKARRRHVEALTARLREIPGDAAAEEALSRALWVLDRAERVVPAATTAAAPEVSAPAEPGPEPEAETRPEVAPAGELVPELETLAVEPVEEPASVPEPELVPEPEQTPEPDPLVLAAAAEAAADRGDLPAALSGFVEAAFIHARHGRANAALDACFQALAIEPADPDLHLVLVRLYLERGWDPLAADKLALLGRLVELSADSAAKERLCAIVAERFPDDPRLAAICA